MKKHEELVNTFYPDDFRFMTLAELDSFKQKGIVYTNALVSIKAFPTPPEELERLMEQRMMEQEISKKVEEKEHDNIVSHKLQLLTLHGK